MTSVDQQEAEPAPEALVVQRQPSQRSVILSVLSSTGSPIEGFVGVSEDGETEARRCMLDDGGIVVVEFPSGVSPPTVLVYGEGHLPAVLDPTDRRWTSDRLELVLDPVRELSIMVQDWVGAPIPAARIGLHGGSSSDVDTTSWPDLWEEYGQLLRRASEAVTDRNGVAEVIVPAAGHGNHFVSVQAFGYWPLEDDILPLETSLPIPVKLAAVLVGGVEIIGGDPETPVERLGALATVHRSQEGGNWVVPRGPSPPFKQELVQEARRRVGHSRPIQWLFAAEKPSDPGQVRYPHTVEYRFVTFPGCQHRGTVAYRRLAEFTGADIAVLDVSADVLQLTRVEIGFDWIDDKSTFPDDRSWFVESLDDPMASFVATTTVQNPPDRARAILHLGPGKYKVRSLRRYFGELPLQETEFEVDLRDVVRVTVPRDDQKVNGELVASLRDAAGRLMVPFRLIVQTEGGPAVTKRCTDEYRGPITAGAYSIQFEYGGNVSPSQRAEIEEGRTTRVEYSMDQEE